MSSRPAACHFILEFWWPPLAGVRPLFRPMGRWDLSLGSSGLLKASMLFSCSTTSSIDGRFLGFPARHQRISWAAWSAAFRGHSSPSWGSITRVIFLWSRRYGLAQFTKFCSVLGRLISSARRPDSISSSTTPNPYTSLFMYRWPTNYLKLLQSSKFEREKKLKHIWWWRYAIWIIKPILVDRRIITHIQAHNT